MKLLNSDIKQFQALYIKHFDQVLSDDEARAELALLVRQMEIVYQPITVEQFDKYLTKYVDEEQNAASQHTK
jgi:hypothetical protein